MRKLFILLFWALLLVGCSNKAPDQYDEKSEKTFLLGVSGETVFNNIMRKNAKVIDVDSCYTKYGYGEVFFDIDSTIDKNIIKKRYAIFSVPANDEFAETYFDFEIRKKDDSYPNFAIRKFNNDSANVNFLLYNNGVFNNVNQNSQIISGETGIYTVKTFGKFDTYKQANLAVLGIEPSVSNNMEDVQKYINSLTPDMINIAEDNTAYVVAYPWRKIKVKIEIKNSIWNLDINFNEIVKLANERIFNQAICSLEVVEDNNYDCRIIFSNGSITPKVTFFDESNKEYSKFSSQKLSYAEIKAGSEYTPCDETDIEREFAYAVAYLLGVSLSNDEKEDTELLNYNLMIPDGCGINLSFRQWNQLHIREKK